MARPKSTPSYRLHKPSGRAVCTISGTDHYLGAWQTPDSYAKYADLLAEWKAGALVPKTVVTVGMLALAYLKRCEVYYRKNGRETQMVNCVKQAFKYVNVKYRGIAVAEFGPLKLQVVQNDMVSAGLCRGYVNKLVGRIKAGFKWGVSQELVPAPIWQALLSVADLRKGRTQARETAPILPVDPELVAETVKHLLPTVAAMVELQRLTGMRPGEVIQVRPRDITLEPGGGAVFRPESHKTEHHGRERRVYIGPQGLKILRPFLERAPDEYCFAPQEALDWHNEQRRANRKTPLYASHLKRNASKRKRSPRREPGECFEVASYRRAIARATRRAFPVPPGATAEQARQWRERHDWHPNQLRHLWATKARRLGGIEAARVGLGHSNLNVTEVYAERDFTAARELARLMG